MHIYQMDNGTENISDDERFQENMRLWVEDESFASLTPEEEDFLTKIECSIPLKPTDPGLDSDANCISFKEFHKWFYGVQLNFKETDEKISNFYAFISSCEAEAVEMAALANKSSAEMHTLKSEYETILSFIQSFCDSCQAVLDEQNVLIERSSSIESRLSYFTDVEMLNRKLNSNLVSSNVDLTIPILTRIDECIIYLTAHPEFKESEECKRKLFAILDKALGLIKSKICDYISLASQTISKPMPNIQSEEAFTVLYGKYRIHAPKVKSLADELTSRAVRISQYKDALRQCEQFYIEKREEILRSPILLALSELERLHQRDMCTLTRSGCSFVMRVCDDEYDLFTEFFGHESFLLSNFLNNYCLMFYDMLRPKIIHIQHVETLAELISIFKTAILDSRSQDLGTFENMCLRLLEDTQERLVYRTTIYMKEQILGYNPVSGDLAYPERLHLMRGISLSLDKERSQTVGTKKTSLPPDLHGMWYPTLRRTLVCLSKSFRCLDNAIFQGLSQEMIVDCIHSLKVASDLISKRSSPNDGYLFLIKHLLMLREQIFPFNVDFAIREASLDFSKIKDAAVEFIKKSSKVLSFRENSFLEFLLQGTLDIRENFIDSKREVDNELKLHCEKFIDETYKRMVSDIIVFNEQVNDWLIKECQNSDESTVSLNSFRTPQGLNEMVVKSYCKLKESVPFIQESLSLYLLNKDIEEILFKLIKGKILTVFRRFSDLLHKYYKAEELNVIGCPTLEQIEALLTTGSELLVE